MYKDWKYYLMQPKADQPELFMCTVLLLIVQMIRCQLSLWKWKKFINSTVGTNEFQMLFLELILYAGMF